MAGLRAEELLLAGYVLTRPGSAPEMSSVPSRIVTISDCITDDLPRPEFWDWFQSTQDVVAARRGLESSTDLVAVALPEAEADALMHGLGGRDMPYFDLLRTGTPAEGELLGYEVVGAEHSLDFHSWHCHSYADQVRTECDIQVNGLGLLATFEEAASVRDWMLARRSREAPSPVPWVVVGLLRPTLSRG